MIDSLKPRARFKIAANVGYRQFDANGREKAMFQQNALFTWLLRKGFITPHAWKIPVLFGMWRKGGITVSNLVTTAGKAGAAGRLMGSGAPAAFDYIAVGTGTTAANIADTTLETESATAGLTRAQGTVSLQTTDTSNDTARVTKTFTVTGTVAVTESGVLNASSSGTLLCRDTFSAINVVNGDTLQITWDVDFD